MRRGDELVVTRIDRLARSIGDLQDIVRELKRKGAFLRAADQPIDTSTAAGKAFVDMLGVFAELKPTCAANGSSKDREGLSGRGLPRWQAPNRRAAVFKLRGDGKGPTEICCPSIHLWPALRRIYRGTLSLKASSPNTEVGLDYEACWLPALPDRKSEGDTLTTRVPNAGSKDRADDQGPARTGRSRFPSPVRIYAMP